MVLPSCPSTPPTPEDALFLSAYELRHWYRQRLLSPIEVTEAALERIEAINPAINAYVTLTPDLARQRAAESHARYRAGNPRPLDGIPTGIKDLFDFLEGVKNTFGSVVFKDIVAFIPDHDAIYVHFMTEAGIVPLGKTNTAEFGHKGTTDNLAWGPTSTPFDLDYNAGGSSGGSAAAVAAFIAHLSQGSDAGGSVRIPAAMTGTVGFKMTYGRIPQDLPVMTHSPFLHPGPITRTVTDCAMLAEVMATPSTTDPLSLPRHLDYLTGLDSGIKDKRIAFSVDADTFPIEADVAVLVTEAAEAFCKAGATVDTVTLGLDQIQVTESDGGAHPYTQADGSALWIAQQSVLYGHANDMLMQATPGGPPPLDLRDFAAQLTPEFLAMINQGYATDAVTFRHGEFLRMNGASGTNGINYMLEQVLADYDYIVTPTVAVTGVPNAADGNTLGPNEINGEPVDPQIGWCLTYLQNFTGHPAISIPAGLAPNGLPVGMQITGRRWDDVGVLRAARAVERHRPWAHLYPRQIAAPTP